jgi:L-alanine-DL-glutamate epimerase-like enolase superfamily enzyme
MGRWLSTDDGGLEFAALTTSSGAAAGLLGRRDGKVSRDEALAPDDLATIEAVREAVGNEMKLMVDFNQGLHLGEALERCRAIDDLGLAWIEEPIVYG